MDSSEDNAQVASITDNSVVSSKGELLTEISLKLDRHKNIAPVEEYTFPDSGSNIIVGGPQHLRKFDLDIADLLPPGKFKSFTTSSGERVEILGWLPAKFKIGNNTTSQPFYISHNVDRIYMSKFALIDLNILPSTYPLPMNHSATVAAIDTETTTKKPKIPPRPKTLPFPATEENIPKLKDYLLTAFADTAFNANAEPFPCMTGPPAHIYLKPDPQPYARHTPIPIPLNWKDTVKEYLTTW